MTCRFGIGVTTRNRARVLDNTLRQIEAHTSEPYRLVVCNDASTDETSRVLAEAAARNPSLVVIESPERLGIAKAKNRCLQALEGCEILFLFDDDCYPVKDGWAELYARAIAETGVQHFNFNDCRGHRPVKRTERGGFTIGEFVSPGGVLMVLGAEVLSKVGAFNERYGLYGFEHETYTTRSWRAGLHGGLGRNLSLMEADDYILSLDYRPEDGPFPDLVIPRGFQSSVTQEEARLSVRRNAREVARDRRRGAIYLPFEGQDLLESPPTWWERWVLGRNGRKVHQ